MCLCILYMCTCVGRLSVFLCVYSIVHLEEGEEERGGSKGRGGVVWRWRSGREGVFFHPEILALQSMSSRCEERGEGRS